MEHLNYNNFFDEYSEIKGIPSDGKYTLPAWPPRLGNMSNFMSGEVESNPMCQNIDKTHDPLSTTSVSQRTASDDIYTMLRLTMRQCIVSQSSLRSSQM